MEEKETAILSLRDYVRHYEVYATLGADRMVSAAMCILVDTRRQLIEAGIPCREVDSVIRAECCNAETWEAIQAAIGKERVSCI